MTDTSQRRPRWWRSRRLRLFLLAGTLVVLIGRVILDLWASSRVEAEVSRLQQKYGSLDGHSVVAPSVPSADNRARVIRAAAALVVPTNLDTDFPRVMAAFSGLAKQPITSRIPDDLRAFVQTNHQAIELTGEARNRHDDSWDADYGGGGNIPNWLDVRTLSTAVYLAAAIDIEGGRAGDATRTLESGLALTASIRHEPVMIAQLLRVAMTVQQCEGIKRLITLSEPSKASLQELSSWLVENDHPDPLRSGLIGEMRFGNTNLVKLESGQDLRSAFWLKPLIWLARPFVRMARIDYLQYMEQLVHVQAGDRPRPSVPPEPKGLFSRLSATGFARTIETGDMFTSVLGATKLGVALRRYRLDHGSYPDDSAVLVPNYLTHMPIDPFTGQPIVYSRRGAGFTIKAQSGDVHLAPNSALEWNVEK